MIKFLAGFAVLLAALGLSGGGLPGFVLVLLIALVVVPRPLGFGRPPVRAVVLALGTGALIQAVYLFVDARLRPDWLWLLAGTFLFNGLAEELVWRGYVYRRLRETRPFWRAVLLTMPFVAVAHVPIIVSSGWVVGTAALAVAAVTSAPLARLYDLGRGTLWAPAILHAAIDAFKLVTVPPAEAVRFSLLLSAASVLIPLLILAVPEPPDLGVVVGLMQTSSAFAQATTPRSRRGWTLSVTSLLRRCESPVARRRERRSPQFPPTRNGEDR